MEKAVLNISKLRITQGMNENFSHQGCLAIDIAGHGDFRAPFTGTIKKTYETDNEVWLESNEPVLYADGTVDYMCLLICHDNDISDLWVGKVIKQNEVFYQEGTKGYVTGKHNHVIVGKGKFTGTGWYKNSQGVWCINNQYEINKALFVYKDVEIINGYGYDWKRTDDFVVNEITPNVERNDKVNQVEVIVEKLRVRKEPNLSGEILGFSNIGFYNVYDQAEADGYIWMKIAEGQWIATVEGEWTIYYPITDYKTLYEQEVEKNKELTVVNGDLQEKNKQLQEKIDKAIEDLK